MRNKGVWPDRRSGVRTGNGFRSNGSKLMPWLIAGSSAVILHRQQNAAKPVASDGRAIQAGKSSQTAREPSHRLDTASMPNPFSAPFPPEFEALARAHKQPGLGFPVKELAWAGLGTATAWKTGLLEPVLEALLTNTRAATQTTETAVPVPKPTPPPAPATAPPPEPPDAKWLRLVPHPSVVLILGKRGAGKSATGYRLLELFRDRAAPYVVGVPSSAQRHLPDWIGIAERLEEVPPGATVLVDEAYIQLHARNSMSREGRDVGTIINLSRQRGQTLIFVVQEARQLDVNAISQADVIAIKELGEISRDFERKELKRFTDQARTAFAGLPGNSRKRWTWVYSDGADFSGLVENRLASFWTAALSKAFSGAAGGNETAPPRKGQRTPRETQAEKAKSFHEAGHGYGTIGKMLGVSKTQAYRLVNG